LGSGAEKGLKGGVEVEALEAHVLTGHIQNMKSGLAKSHHHQAQAENPHLEANYQ
jgi:hypothetical protein